MSSAVAGGLEPAITAAAAAAHGEDAADITASHVTDDAKRHSWRRSKLKSK